MTFDLLKLSFMFNLNLLHIIHRIIVLLLFTLIIFIIPYALRNLKESNTKILALAVAIGLTYIYVTKDFMFGFYGAYLDNSKGIIPFMYASETFTAYRDTGKLIELDPHTNFFSHFLLVHTLALILDMNYIVVYYTTYKLFFVTLWTILALLLMNHISKTYLTYPTKWLIKSFIISTIFISSINGYNVGGSEATWILALFLISLLIKDKIVSIHDIIVFVFLTLAISFNSFRETLILLGISIMYLLTKFLLCRRRETRLLNHYLMLIILMILLARSTIFINEHYTIHYLSIVEDVFNAIIDALTKTPSIKEEKYLVSIKHFESPLDSLLTRISIYAYAIYLLLNLLLSVIFVFRALLLNSKHSLLRCGHSTTVIIISSAYVFIVMSFFSLYVLHVMGFTERDFSTFRILFLALNVIIPIVWRNIIDKPLKEIPNITKTIVIFLLILVLILAPQYLHAIEVKSVVDIYRLQWNINTIVFYANNIYEFLRVNTSKEVLYFSNDYILLTYYGGVIRYTLNSLLYSIGGDINISYNISTINVVFNNGVYEAYYLGINKIHIIKS